MSQEYSSRRQRRSNRARAGRPVLVTSSDTTNTPGNEEQTSTATDVVEPELLPVPIAPPTSTTRQRKLPRFFSNISKSEDTQATTTNEQTVAQARIARATRGKTPPVPTAKATSEPKQQSTAKPATQATPRPAANRPPAQQGFFKTRYIIGLGIYLLVADFVGVFEAQLLNQWKLETVLAQFNLFGLPIRVSTSTIVFLATLVIVLVALAYFDLLPRSLSAARNTSTGSGTNRSSTSSTPAERTPQLTMRQGVKGSDDDLYQAYRSNQRREKKR
ncbi:MAG TPA: hypothetical protein DHW02_16295 [Ktedonobacter sp.]|nr:hypothetical protein [Ktedonobacter sp.]